MKEDYPLEDLLRIKIKRFDQAVKAFEEKTEKLLKEQEKLFELEEERDKVIAHKMKKLEQLREVLDKGFHTDKAQQMKVYLDTVKEKIKTKQKKVDAQIKVVDKAEKDLEVAKKNLFEKRKDLEKINIHKDEWRKEISEIQKRLEAIEQDEIGSVRNLLRKYEERRKK